LSSNLLLSALFFYFIYFMKPLYLVAALTFISASCGKSAGADPAPVDVVAYQGSVQVVDPFGMPVSSNYVSVTITETTPNWTVRTDVNGKYIMNVGNGVSAGIHQLRYSAPGGTSYLKANVATGSAPQRLVTLGSFTTTRVTMTAARTGANYVVQGSVDRPLPGQPRPYRLFFIKSVAPAPLPSIANSYALTVGGNPAPDGTFSVSLTPAELSAAGFRPGDEVLVFGTGDTPAVSTYPDPATGKTVYPACNVAVTAANTAMTQFSFQ
jgi:hypothetical protein